MSNTPETDKYIHFNRIETEEERNLADFARRLERQRNEARRKMDEHKIALEFADKSNNALFAMLEKAREQRDEAEKALQLERDLPSNLLDVNLICQQRDEARQELLKTIEQRDGAFYLIEYAGELLGVKPQEHKSAHGFQVLQAIKDLINKSQ